MRQHEVVNPLRGNASPLACKAVIDNQGYFGPFLSEAEWWRRFHSAFNVTLALDDPERRYGITDVTMAKGAAAKKAAKAAKEAAAKQEAARAAAIREAGMAAAVVAAREAKAERRS